jgi:hypothetical protein
VATDERPIKAYGKNNPLLDFIDGLGSPVPTGQSSPYAPEPSIKFESGFLYPTGATHERTKQAVQD